MAFLISRRLTNNFLTSSRSSALSLLLLPSTTAISEPYSYFDLLHSSSSSSSTPSHPSLKPQVLEPKFIRSAPFSTFRPSKPTFSPSNDSNPETRSSGQIPSSIHSSLLENELRDSLRKSMENIKGLKNALKVLGFVHIGIGAWVLGSLPFYPSFLTHGLLASTVPLYLASKMQRCLQIVSLLNMETEGGLFLISKLAWLAAWRLFMVEFCLLVVELGVFYFTPHDVVMIPRIRISMITMILFPVLCALQIQRMPSMLNKLVKWQLEGKVDDLILSSNGMKRREVLKVANIFLLRLKNASYLAAGLSCSWLLCVHLHSYGILTFYVIE